jgi:hypothetical protein
MYRAFVLIAASALPATVQATNIELVWYVTQGPSYTRYVTTFRGIPVAAGPGRLYIHARGDYSPGLDDADPEMIAFDLDGLYAPIELAARQAGKAPAECTYPGIFPDVENVAASHPASALFPPSVYCLPIAGPDKGASIIEVHGGSPQDVEWEQEFVLDYAGLSRLTADNEFTLYADALEAENFFLHNGPDAEQAAPPYFEFRLSYEVSEPDTSGLLSFALIAFGVASLSRRTVPKYRSE